MKIKQIARFLMVLFSFAFCACSASPENQSFPNTATGTGSSSGTRSGTGGAKTGTGGTGSNGTTYGCADGFGCSDPLWCISGKCVDPITFWSTTPLPTEIRIYQMNVSDQINYVSTGTGTFSGSANIDTLTVVIDTKDYASATYSSGTTGIEACASGAVTDFTALKLTGHVDSVTMNFTGTGTDGDGVVFYSGSHSLTDSALSCTIELIPVKRAATTVPNGWSDMLIRLASFGQAFLYNVKCIGTHSIIVVSSTLDGCGTNHWTYADAPMGYFGYIAYSADTGNCGSALPGYESVCWVKVGMETRFSRTVCGSTCTASGSWQIDMKVPDPNWTLYDGNGVTYSFTCAT